MRLSRLSALIGEELELMLDPDAGPEPPGDKKGILSLGFMPPKKPKVLELVSGWASLLALALSAWILEGIMVLVLARPFLAISGGIGPTETSAKETGSIGG